MGKAAILFLFLMVTFVSVEALCDSEALSLTNSLSDARELVIDREIKLKDARFRESQARVEFERRVSLLPGIPPVAALVALNEYWTSIIDTYIARSAREEADLISRIEDIRRNIVMKVPGADEKKLKEAYLNRWKNRWQQAVWMQRKAQQEYAFYTILFTGQKALFEKESVSKVELEKIKAKRAIARHPREVAAERIVAVNRACQEFDSALKQCESIEPSVPETIKKLSEIMQAVVKR